MSDSFNLEAFIRRRLYCEKYRTCRFNVNIWLTAQIFFVNLIDLFDGSRRPIRSWGKVKLYISPAEYCTENPSCTHLQLINNSNKISKYYSRNLVPEDVMKFKVKQKSTNMKTNLSRAYNERQEFLMTSLREKKRSAFSLKDIDFRKGCINDSSVSTFKSLPFSYIQSKAQFNQAFKTLLRKRTFLTFLHPA